MDYEQTRKEAMRRLENQDITPKHVESWNDGAFEIWLERGNNSPREALQVVEMFDDAQLMVIQPDVEKMWAVVGSLTEVVE